MNAPRFHDGVLVVDSRPRFLIAGDYPYYRDQPTRWAGKLAQMRAAGIEVVTCYVPWRHHLVEDAGARRFVFANEGLDSRDLVGFLREVERAGLLALIKPGPFVHGELQLGGLPDHVSPTNDPSISPSLAADGSPETSQGLALPSALCPAFLRATDEWLAAVAAQVARPLSHPQGPIIAVQLGNEGIYSNASAPIVGFDYSPAAIDRYRQQLARTYRSVDVLVDYHGCAKVSSFAEIEAPRAWTGGDGLVAILDHGRFAASYLNQAFLAWRKHFLGIATTVNLLPPALASWHPSALRRGHLDAWLTRVRPEGLPEATQYGFTSWVGMAIEDDETLVNYGIAAKRRRGPNLEENWSLRWSDPRCAHAATTIYQALYAIGLGATGFNVYPAVETDSWGPQLAMDREYLARTLDDPSIHDPPYGREAPIRCDGTPGPKFSILRLLTTYLARVGESLIACRPRHDLAWGLHAAYSTAAAWNPPTSERWHGLRLPQAASESLAAFMLTALARDVGHELVDLESTPLEALRARSTLVVCASYFMAEAVQEKLVAYVEGGGRLVMCWESPLYDELGQRCELLQDCVLGHGFAGPEQPIEIPALGGQFDCRPLRIPDDAEPLLASTRGHHGYRVARGAGELIYWDVAVDERTTPALLAELGFPALEPGADGAIWLELRHPERDHSFLAVLDRHDEATRLARSWHDERLEIDLPRRGCALLEIANGRLESCFVKGVNELHGDARAVRVRLGRDCVEVDHGCDLVAHRRGDDGYDITTDRGAR